MKIDKLKNAIKNKKTVLAVGPMSKNCIDATIEIAQLRNIPIQFIPSRRQIESNDVGHYIFSDPKFLELKSKVERKVSNNIDIDEKVRENIKYKINYYLESFGWND